MLLVYLVLTLFVLLVEVPTVKMERLVTPE